MPYAQLCAVSSLLDARSAPTCDECGAALRLYAHRCDYCLNAVPRPTTGPSSVRARLAAKVDQQEATRSPWIDPVSAFFNSDAFKRIEGGRDACER